MTATQKRRKSTAFHEAGYAVIARVLTLPAGSASIKPDYDEGAWSNASSSSHGEVQVKGLRFNR